MVRLTRWCALLALALLSLPSSRALGDEAAVQRAKGFYSDGKREFERGRFDTAYVLFQRAYIASPRPALLFNQAACLSALGRPAEAANLLRSYLAAVPREPERALIEERIAALDGAAVPGPRPASEAETTRNQELERRIRILEARLGAEDDGGDPAERSASRSPERSSSRRGLAIGLGVAAGVLVLGGIGVGLGFALAPSDRFTPSSYGGPALAGTR